MAITSWGFAGLVIVAAGVYYLLPRRGQNIWLLAVSYTFVATWAWQFAVTLAAATAINYGLAHRVRRGGQPSRVWLWAAISLNLLALALLKYAGFFVAQAAALIGSDSPGALSILLPIGLSYIVLQLVSYQVDVYRAQLEPSRDLIDFALYLAYFPKLVAGPIERAREFFPRLAAARTVDNETLGRGGALITMGLLRKVVFANALAQTVSTAVLNDPLGYAFGALTNVSWLLFYGVYLYNDFAGYTSLVRGVSLLFGIELTPNFQTPFFARTFGEFWNSWHISLSHWLRDYIYFPVSRALLRRSNNARALPNIVVPPLVTMLISGLWHGATLNLLVWGLMHGLFQAVERLLAVFRPVVAPDKWPRWRQALGMSVVTVCVTLAWAPFRADLGKAIAFYQSLGSWGIGLSGVNWHVLIIVLPSLWLDFAQAVSKDELFIRRWPVWGQAAGLALIIALVIVSSGGSAPKFVYQGF